MRWIRFALGVVIAVVGVVLVFRPFTSLAVLIVAVSLGLTLVGVTELVDARDTDPVWPAIVVGVVSIVAAVLLVSWPDVTVRGVALVAAVTLLVHGVVDIAQAVRGATDERVAASIGGFATLVFGGLALAWPTVTLLVVAVLFGVQLVRVGGRVAWNAIRRPRASSPSLDGRPRPERHLVGAVAMLVGALLLAAVSVVINRGAPTVDAFYDTPDDVPAAPGVLLRSESFTRTIPKHATAWRILYTTTRFDGVAAVASALVVVPDLVGDEPMPVIALAHGTTGIARTCAPSLLPEPFEAGAFFALDEVLAEGWAVVATDYIGLGTESPHPYLIGQPSARAVLDAVRAAHHIDGADLADETVVWGHSQGGGAALWTGMIAPEYAPDTNVVGVAALAPASDLVGLVDRLATMVGGSIFATYVIDAYAAVYDDVEVDEYVRPTARPTFDAVAGRCLTEPGILVSALGSLVLGMSAFWSPTPTGPLVDRLEQNVPTGAIDAPVLIAQGADDSLILASVQDDYVADRCAGGQPVDYRVYPGLDHVPLVEADSPLIPELVDWTNDRFAGLEPTPTCG